MSLFDDDGSLSTSSSASSDSHEDEKSVAASGKMLSSSAVREAFGMRSRFTLTAEDLKKQKAAQSPLRGVGAVRGGLEKTEGVSDGKSKFVSSISSALQLRQADKIRLMRQRLVKQRAEDAKDANLVAKDLEVGVFVTDAYKQALRESQESRRTGGESVTDRATKDGPGKGSVDDFESPLDGFIQQLTDQPRPALTESGKTEEDEARPASRDGVTAQRANIGDESLPVAETPSMAELRQLVSGGPASSVGASGEAHRRSAITKAGETQGDDSAARRARVARKVRRADQAVLEACASRAEGRMLQRAHALGW